MSRTSKSIRNVIVAALGQVLVILTGFVARKIFVIFLADEYLGVNGLFTSVLTVLSLAELGVGPAIIFSLYKPLAENNIPVCQALMRIFKRAYLAIGTVVLAAGLAITPFITVFIKEVPDSIQGIHWIYVLFVLNTAISYFYSYKRSLITASQNHYWIDGVHTAAYIIMNVLQIGVLALTSNYFLFLGLQIASTLTENVILSRKADREFPWLKEKSDAKLPDGVRREIVRNIKAMVLHRIGGIAVDSTDNLLISKFFGLLFLGLYSNYLLIFSAVKSVTGSFFSSITASIGNFGAQESPEKANDLYRKVQFINSWMAAFCGISLFVLMNPFVETLWLGRDYLLSTGILLVLVINFYLNTMRKTVLTFKEAYGLPWHDRYKPVAAALVNLTTSIILAKKLGVIGVFLGTTITELFVNIWVEGYVVFKHCLHRSLGEFLKLFASQVCVFLLCGVVTVGVSSCMATGIAFLDFVLKCLTCLVIPNALYVLIYWRTKEFGALRQIFSGIMSRMKKG